MYRTQIVNYYVFLSTKNKCFVRKINTFYAKNSIYLQIITFYYKQE